MPFKPQTVLVYARCFLWKCTYSHEWSEKGRPLLCSPTLSCPVISLFVYVCVQSHNTVHYHFIIHSAGICLFLCVYLLIEHYVHSACMLHVRVCVQVCVQVYICVCVCVCVWKTLKRLSSFQPHLNPSILQLEAIEGASGKSSLHVSQLCFLHFRHWEKNLKDKELVICFILNPCSFASHCVSSKCLNPPSPTAKHTLFTDLQLFYK